MTVDQRVLSQHASATREHVVWWPGMSWRLLMSGLVLIDTVALLAGFALAHFIRFEAGLPILEELPIRRQFYTEIAFWSVPTWLITFALYRLYDRRSLFSGFQEYVRVIHACTIGVLLVICVSFIEVDLIISRGWLLLTWFLSIILVSAGRFGTRRVIRSCRRHGMLVTPTLIVGTNQEGLALADHFREDPASGLRVVGFINTPGCPDDVPESGPAVIGGLSNIKTLIAEMRITEIIVAPTALTRDELLDLYRILGHDSAVQLRFSSGLFEVLTTGITVQETSCVPLVTPDRVRITGIDAALKAAIDYTVSFFALLALSPVLLTIAAIVRIDSPGPIFHRRRVLGRGGRVFDAFKFRTMVVDADRVLATDAKLRQSFENGFKLKSDPRITRVGRFLRRTSLDELPQLLNVLRGEMSLVGPRMIVPSEAGRYGKWQLNLLTVKPGITGPWQVRGRSDIPYEDRIRLNMQYIRNYSIWLDLEILLRTIPAVLGGQGAY
jgi:exopolysaccharide biosynthesis polyprenyl glycosylphosphotransferase